MSVNLKIKWIKTQNNRFSNLKLRSQIVFFKIFFFTVFLSSCFYQEELIFNDTSEFDTNTSTAQDIGSDPPDSNIDPSDSNTDLPDSDTELPDSDTELPDSDMELPDSDTELSDDTCVPTEEICDEIDNNCNDEIDEGDVCAIGECSADMVQITDDMANHTFCIDLYEASQSDATSDSPGTSNELGSSRSGVLPWGNVSFDNAEAQCATLGKRLCSQAEWIVACGGNERRTYPYDNAYIAETCNGSDVDPRDSSVETGSFASCISPDGTFDMSGNLEEWTNIRSTRGGSFSDIEMNLKCNRPAGEMVPLSDPGAAVGFRCCADLGTQ